MRSADLAQCESPHGHGEGLCAGVARLTCDYGQQDRERGKLGNRILEDTDDRSREKGGYEVDMEPG